MYLSTLCLHDLRIVKQVTAPSPAIMKECVVSAFRFQKVSTNSRTSDLLFM
jgi:hypothetical protein